MSIATYSELQTAIADFLNRDDLSAAAPTFIALAEADMNRRIRHWRMENRTEFSVSSQYEALPFFFPDSWLENITFNLLTPYRSRLEPMPRPDMLSRREGTADAPGRPKYYTMTAGDFELFPTPDGSYNAELIYYARIDALSDFNTSNWILDHHQDAYLYGALLHAAPYLVDDARVPVWSSFYNGAIEAINETGKAASLGGDGLRMKTRAMT